MDIKVAYSTTQPLAVADKNKPSANKASAVQSSKPSKPTEAVYMVSPEGDVFEA